MCTRVNSHMVLVVGGAGKRASAAGLRTVVGTLSSVRTDVDFANV